MRRTRPTEPIPPTKSSPVRIKGYAATVLELNESYANLRTADDDFQGPKYPARPLRGAFGGPPSRCLV